MILLHGVHLILVAPMSHLTNRQHRQDPLHIALAGGHSLALARGLMDEQKTCYQVEEKG